MRLRRPNLWIGLAARLDEAVDGGDLVDQLALDIAEVEVQRFTDFLTIIDAEIELRLDA